MLRLCTAICAALMVASMAYGTKKCSGKGVGMVICLLEEMKAEVEADGKAAAETYEKFACWCKETTESKKASIKQNEDDIDTHAADMEDYAASKALKETELAELKAGKEKAMKDLEDETVST